MAHHKFDISLSRALRSPQKNTTVKRIARPPLGFMTDRRREAKEDQRDARRESSKQTGARISAGEDKGDLR